MIAPEKKLGQSNGVKGSNNLLIFVIPIVNLYKFKAIVVFSAQFNCAIDAGSFGLPRRGELANHKAQSKQLG